MPNTLFKTQGNTTVEVRQMTNGNYGLVILMSTTTKMTPNRAMNLTQINVCEGLL